MTQPKILATASEYLGDTLILQTHFFRMEEFLPHLKKAHKTYPTRSGGLTDTTVVFRWADHGRARYIRYEMERAVWESLEKHGYNLTYLLMNRS